MSLGKFLKNIAPIAISAFAGPAIGQGIGQLFSTSAVNPFVSRALTGAVTSKLFGGKDKDALRNALLSGIGGMALDSFGAQQANTVPKTTNLKAGPSQSMVGDDFSPALDMVDAKSGGSKPPIEQTKDAVQGIKNRTFTGELLKSTGISDDNLLARLLNTRMGEGLTAGLIAQLLAGDDDEEQLREFEERPFGFGGPGGKLGGITYRAEGGPMNFPRRTGGIDPSEGSGTKDDVPAMLMAGEFVLTKDAVKGLGDGNQRKGIQRAYDMMDNLEARA